MNELRKKFIRSLRLILKYTDQNMVIQIISDIINSELRLRTTRGDQGSAPSRDLCWAT